VAKLNNAGTKMNIVGLTRLLRMMRILIAQDALLPPNFKTEAPLKAKLGRALFTLGARSYDSSERGQKLSAKISSLGPSYIKLGQFLATRPDIIGDEIAADLRLLQDKMAPFDVAIAERMLKTELANGGKTLGPIGPAIAAASVAQVHKVSLRENPDVKYAVKFLRPNIEKILTAETALFMSVAKLCEAVLPKSRRLRPVAIAKTIRRVMEIETDLRFEAAALSEMAENTKDEPYFKVPAVIWEASGKRVLTMEWMNGVSANDTAALRAAGHNMEDIAARLIQSFLSQALHHGFFHADLHQGNLMIGEDSSLIAIDFGITGRLDADNRRFLAEILHGFIIRDYNKVAEVHFEAGYVPQRHGVAEFAQALRSIGEPIRDQNADNISMAHLLSQLFEVTEQFEMETQPQLILLQKTMVSVEGVARSFDPSLNIWTAAEPTVSDWMKKQIGPEAHLRAARDGLVGSAKALAHLPVTLQKLEAAAEALSEPEDPPVAKRDWMTTAIATLGLALALAAVWLAWV